MTLVVCDTNVCVSVVTNQFIAWTYTEGTNSNVHKTVFMSSSKVDLTCYMCSYCTM